MKPEEIFEFVIIDENATVPYRKRETDAGFDISSVNNVEILPGELASIPVGLQISAPTGWYYTIEGRSGMLMKGIVASSGTIDAGYVGDIYVLLHNHSKEKYCVSVGDRIAQVVPHKIRNIEFLKRDVFSPEYDVRGKDGWSSSGK